MEAGTFRPPPGLRSPHLQSILASSTTRGRLIRLRGNAGTRRDPVTTLDCGEGVRLKGAYSAPAGSARHRGLVVLLHGWEGSIDSTYMLSAARSLWSRGYSLFRLNFRDHGGTHDLNAGIFHSCRLAEVVGAVSALLRQFSERPVYLVGFSLGGNFALRVALSAPGAGIELRHVVAICPVVDPAHSLAAIERAPAMYGRTFLRKFRRSLMRKQRSFPDLYDLRPCLSRRTVREMTAWMIDHVGEFDDLDDYLQGYSVARERLASLQIPSTIVTAADDPIIPVADFREISAPSCLAVEIEARGGHCGFLAGPWPHSWIDRRIARILEVAGG